MALRQYSKFGTLSADGLRKQCADVPSTEVDKLIKAMAFAENILSLQGEVLDANLDYKRVDLVIDEKTAEGIKALTGGEAVVHEHLGYPLMQTDDGKYVIRLKVDPKKANIGLFYLGKKVAVNIGVKVYGNVGNLKGGLSAWVRGDPVVIA